MTSVRGGRFATTRWTMINAAGGASSASAAAALAELCQIYWPPLYSYLRRRGHDAQDAQDLTQGFFARLLERQDFRVADRSRGRFRAFLLTALKRYAINEHKRARAARRGGGQVRLSLDFEEAERTYAVDRRDDETPDRAFDRKWAGIAIDRAVHRLRRACRDGQAAAMTDVLLPYLTDSGDLPAYRAVAAELGLTEGAVKVAVHRLRQRFGTALRQEIGQTVVADEDVEAEMRDLIRAISA
jgi:RNA polymerase sigma-70 factor (ECF subfamily)